MTLAPGKVRLSATRGGDPYDLLIVNDEALDYASARQIYDRQTLDPGQLTLISNISPLSRDGYPFELMAADLKQMIPPNQKYVATKGNGRDILSLSFTQGQASGKTVVELDAKGQPLRIVRESRSPMGNSYREVIFSSITLKPKLGSDAFVMKAPAEFVPFQLPTRTPGIAAGFPFPLDEWSLENKLGKKTSLLYLIFADDPRASLALELVRSLKIPTYRLGAPGDKSADGRARSQAIYKSVAKGGSPLFLLVNPKGGLEHAWLGLSPSILEATRSEMKMRIDELAKSATK